MKKTLVTLLAAASCSVAFGATPLSLEEVTTAQLAENPTSAATVALTLNIDALKEIAGAGFGGISEANVIFAFSGAWGNGTTGELGVCNNGSSAQHITSIYCYALLDATSSKNVSTGLGALFDSNTDWNSFDAISLVCSMVNSTEEQVALTTALSIRYTDGSIVTYGGQSADIRWNSGAVHGFTAGGVTFSDELVLSSTTYTGALSLDEAKAFSADLVPEPTTATLSLLALAGLAVRRRRK